jgi:hypothetical protein
MIQGRTGHLRPQSVPGDTRLDPAMAALHHFLRSPRVGLVAIVGVLLVMGGASASAAPAGDRATQMMLDGCCCVTRPASGCCCEGPESSSSGDTHLADAVRPACMDVEPNPPSDTCQCRSIDSAAPASPSVRPAGESRGEWAGQLLPAGAPSASSCRFAVYAVIPTASPPTLPLYLLTVRLLI